jgi:hypothetical protein
MERGEIRDVSPAIAISETASAQTSIDVSALLDGAWANPTPSADASLAQIAALIKALPGPTPITHVRLAAIFVLEPRYLSRRLPERERSTWSRLVGHAAELVKDSKVVELAPSIPAGWRRRHPTAGNARNSRGLWRSHLGRRAGAGSVCNR